MNGHGSNNKIKGLNIQTEIKTKSSLNKNEEEFKNNDVTTKMLNQKEYINEHNKYNHIHNSKYPNLLKNKKENMFIDEKKVIINEKNKYNTNDNVINENVLLIDQKTVIKKKNIDKKKLNTVILNQNNDKKEEKINYKNLSLIILKNDGNTTYINSVIRIISNIKDISKYYLDHTDIITKNKFEMPISYFYSRILYHLNTPAPSNFSLAKFYNILTEYNHVFKGNETKDAIDFLIYFINELHEENKLILNYKKNHNEINFHNYNNYLKYLNENENTKIFANFYWINKKYENCLSCNHEKITFQKFFTYDLDFKNSLNNKLFNRNKNNNNKLSESVSLSVLDCLKYASDKKIIYNIFCDKCNKNYNFQKISSIVLSSKYIIFLIGAMDNKLINKIKEDNIIIHINKELDFSKLFDNNTSFYTLYGFIVYDLEQLEYIAYCISPYNKKWYKYVKDKILSVELTDFIYNCNYKLIPVILLYECN